MMISRPEVAATITRRVLSAKMRRSTATASSVSPGTSSDWSCSSAATMRDDSFGAVSGRLAELGMTALLPEAYRQPRGGGLVEPRLPRRARLLPGAALVAARERAPLLGHGHQRASLRIE